ncbi:hypothetical protein [Nocardioides sp. KR10-350]|uniref:hypothetical protein n=1 Tax=Nocardioides cheoyonin TaxID=3156615 RepID=UPI0032B54829
MSRSREPEKKPVRDPVQWLFNAALMVLGVAIALQLAFALLADVLPWIAGLALVTGGGYVAWRLYDAKRRW